jgi:hypothetical protein
VGVDNSARLRKGLDVLDLPEAPFEPWHHEKENPMNTEKSGAGPVILASAVLATVLAGAGLLAQLSLSEALPRSADVVVRRTPPDLPPNPDPQEGCLPPAVDDDPGLPDCGGSTDEDPLWLPGTEDAPNVGPDSVPTPADKDPAPEMTTPDEYRWPFDPTPCPPGNGSGPDPVAPPVFDPYPSPYDPANDPCLPYLPSRFEDQVPF